MEYEENSSLEAKVVKDFDKVLYVTKVWICPIYMGVYADVFSLIYIGINI